jgi:carboxyl-terminal processing protease
LPCGHFDKKDTNKDWEYQLSKFSKIYSSIKENYPAKVNKKKLFYSSIQGLLKRMDPHSYFLDSDAQRTLNEDQEGNYFGIGTRITKYEEDLTVVMPLKGTPAYKLGIMAGDIIITIDGESTRNMSLDGAMRRLRGIKDTYVNIEIIREGIDKPIPFKIKRAEIPLESISYAMAHPLEPQIGYISIRTFGNTTAKEFVKKIDKLIKEDGIRALILDLRGNAGGSLYAAVDVADFFLVQEKQIVSIKGRNLNQSFSARKNNQYEGLPLAVLINRGSASASEIVASALQENKRALIIGSRSWGKGLVQVVHKLSLDNSVALTTAKYYTPSNKCLQRDYSRLDDYLSILYNKDYNTDYSIQGGVIPDMVVKDDVYSPLMIKFISRGLFFRFSRELINSGLKIDKDFSCDNTIIQKFRLFLLANKIQYEASKFKKNLDYIRVEIERDTLANAFSAAHGIGVYLKSDPVTQKAVEQLKIKLQENNINRPEKAGEEDETN